MALQAGGDLGPFRRWMTARHLVRCTQCRDEVARFEEMREILPELSEMPEIAWNRLAAEIKANVRLGLEAGECVRAVEIPLRRPAPTAGWRSAVACASIVLLLVGCLVLEHPSPIVAHAAGTTVRSTNYGIQVQTGDERMLGLMNGGAQKVTYTLDAQGSMGARYVDPETGSVTINTVYAQ